MTPSKISERESNTTRTRTYTGPTGAVSDLSGLSTKTRCSYVRPRQQRRLCVAVAIVQQQQQQQQYSEERRRSRLSPSSSSSLPIGLSSTLPLFLTLMALSLVSIEKIPLQTLAFSNSNSNIHGSNNNNRNDFRSRIPTIRTRISGTGGAFYGSGNTSRGTAAATSTTATTRAAARIIPTGARTRNFGTHLVAMSMSSGRVGGYNDDDKKDDDKYVDDLYEKFDDEKIFPLGFNGDENNNEEDSDSDKEYLQRGLDRLEDMEKMLQDIEEYCSIEGMCEDDDDDGHSNIDGEDDTIIADKVHDDDDDELMFTEDEDDLEDMDFLLDFLEETVGNDEDDDEDEEFITEELRLQERLQEQETAKSPAAARATAASSKSGRDNIFSPIGLEEALLQGVVPVDAGVGSGTGSGTLPGDFGFDPFHFADKDYVQEFQYRLLNWLPGGNPSNDPLPEPRPTALVLRDYREAEIRHGRLAMLAVVIWPIQEKLDNFVLGPDAAGPLLYGPVTLPYLPLFMTLLMMLLGYLDIYTKDIQEEEGIGDAFLPGDCFWDPLRILEGAPPTMKRNMQERELFNGRVAMLAFAAFVFEELTSHQGIVDIPGNEVLFVPAYQIPIVQEWLDSQFLQTYNR
mmetsp:Transcript_11211/g.23656  ORF Transcript_11211/g.23656 Transcript_11211/m.23656 type:complete len:626 (-) Transcript_11211:165-2042(-)|eukprot:CAMPEP_0168171116 /NCGR_PEP_ID=MMETSP0139_2-20121125/4535_1 /TAXON_ID=44445 /ORGANISM="Pseudo-nitzschia australis, Strain 10249 10 AB" /LENGTH=625 /DNA_ID=CAMNT_0008088651 /DNA_START=142 /DNA_END=2019 /DNA_ORIENTATION=-